MPPVDQKEIVSARVRSPFVSGADVHGAFQQICIADKDVHKGAFMSIRGTAVSLVAQQGD